MTIMFPYVYIKGYIKGLSLDVVKPYIYVITKKPQGIGASFGGEYISFANDIAMFILLMESSSWFA